jgi:hypothetical protein
VCLERLYSILGLYVSISIALCLTAAMAAAVPAETAVRIDTIADRYALHDFSFEVSPETGRAGIRLEYDYPPARTGDYDGNWDPSPRIALLPSLTYDTAAHAIVYDDGAAHTTCATEVGRTVAFWKTAHMKPTGACRVSARVTQHAESDGWSTHRYNTLDTYFEVHHK